MKKLIIASICVALGVVLSTTSIPIGPARIFPYDKCDLSRYSWGEILCRRSL